MNGSTSQWYVAVGDASVGPVGSELVIRGIESRKIPPEALVCAVGESAWAPLAGVEDFHRAVIRSYPPPPPDSQEARYWLEHGFNFPTPARMPSFDDAVLEEDEEEEEQDTLSAIDLSDDVDEEDGVEADDVVEADVAASAPTSPQPRPEEAERSSDSEEPGVSGGKRPPIAPAAATIEPDLATDIDVDWDSLASARSPIDWSHPFQGYFLTSDHIELPEERALLESLSLVPRDTFRHDEALWNLALCLAFGSDALGNAAARTFFEAVTHLGSTDRLEWMSRTLLGNGFVPSGIPATAGQLAFKRLKSVCPPSLAAG